MASASTPAMLLPVTNPVAGAYAEKSPIVVISGAPGLKERQHVGREVARQRPHAFLSPPESRVSLGQVDHRVA